METAIVYMAAGLSSRFAGKVKQLEKVGSSEETLIEISVDHAIQAGFKKIVFIVGDKTESSFKEMFGNMYKGVPVFYTRQEFDTKIRDRPWGTTHAALTIKPVIDCPFLLTNADELYGTAAYTQMREALERGENAVLVYTLLSTLPEEGEVTRGTYKVEDGFVLSMVENFKVSRQNLKEKNLTEDTPANVNVFALQPTVLDDLHNVFTEFKKQHTADRRKEAIIGESLSKLVEGGKLKMRYYTSKGYWIGITNPGDEKIVKDFLAK